MDSSSHTSRAPRDQSIAPSAKTGSFGQDQARNAVPAQLAQRVQQTASRLTPADVQYLQRTVGNRQVSQLLGRGSGSTPVVQRTPLGDFVKDQERLQTDAKQHPNTYEDKYTTVGFEHEFAQMTDGRLQGVSHVEIAESREKMPYTGLGFVLETDASNALELVSPPFLLETVHGRPLPLPNEVENVDNLFRLRLDELTNPKPTLGELVNEMKNDNIEFGLKDISVKRENMTPRTKDTVYNKTTKDRSKLLRAELSTIPLQSSLKGGGITTHVNFATDLETFHLMEQVSDSPTEDWRKSYIGIEQALFAKMKEICFSGSSDSKGKMKEEEDDGSEELRDAQSKFGLFATAAGAYLKLAKTIFDKHRSKTATKFAEYLHGRDTEVLAILNTIMSELDAGNLESEPLQILTMLHMNSGSLLHNLTEMVQDFIQKVIVIRCSTQLAMEMQNELNGDTAEMTRLHDEAVVALKALPFRRGRDRELSMFLSSLARTLSGQLAVPALKDLRNAQKDRFKNPGSKTLANLPYQPMATSRIKDVHEVWIKDTILNLGLGVLSPQEWQTVGALAKNTAFRNHVRTGLPNVNVSGTQITSATYSRAILSALDQLKDQIKKHKLDQTDSQGRAKVNKDRTFLNPTSRPKLFSHDSKWIGARQDTYIPAENVQMPLWQGKRLHVVESRSQSVEALSKVRDLYSAM